MKGSKWMVALAGLVAGLLLCEGGLRWIAPQVYRRPPVWQFDPELGWSHIPRSSGWLVSPEFAVEYRINAAGLRNREIAQEKRPGQQRLLCFGDSFVEGWGVREEERVSEQLEQGLGGVEVVNFGVAGYGTDQEWLLFEKQGAQYHPDWVVLFFYGNDLWNNAARQGIGAERGFKPFFQLGTEGRLQLRGVPVRKAEFWDQQAVPWQRRFEAYLQQHWHLYALGRKMMAPEVPAQQQQRYYQGLYGKGEEQGAENWELTGRLLQAFDLSVRQAGGRLLVVCVPALVQIEEEDWKMKRELHGLVGEYDLQKPGRQLQGLTAAYRIPFLDLYAAFKERARSQTLYFRDSHWNARGHELAAGEVAVLVRALQQGPVEASP
ncbi:MAG: SGNH/GDSL hydrolase family protein [Candidatus Latescibacteria bacterium]|nr:SGNH/GDSL hydrolase family protein [Candidatus Latescibacterota bacterium]